MKTIATQTGKKSLPQIAQCLARAKKREQMLQAVNTIRGNIDYQACTDESLESIQKILRQLVEDIYAD